MPEVLSGTQPGLTVGDILQSMGHLTGNSTTDPLFRNACIGWINEILRDVQLSDPKARRTMVIDAPFTLNASQSEYDVRATVPDGGFGWTNCHEVANLVATSYSRLPLEMMSVNQYRNRAGIYQHEGPPTGVVVLDQFRIRIVPTAEQEYTGEGDYWQTIPKITSDAQKIDWPSAWDSALQEGVAWKALQWQHTEQPGVYGYQEKVYLRKLADKKAFERSTNQRPKRAVVTRYLRGRRVIPSDNSADIYWNRRR